MKTAPAPASPPRKRKRFDLHKALFVLPNAFTASSIFCGFFAMTKCMGNATPEDLYRAGIAILYGTMFDMFDGRVARLTKTQSEFGREFDSLADVVTFGVAPSLLVYKWALGDLGASGLFLSFLFCACGAIRLARFNVLATRETGPSNYFIGLPIPLAAAALVSLVLATHNSGVEDLVQQQTVAVVVVMLSFLMVSTVRYRTFKELKFNRKSLTIMFTLGLACAYVTTAMKPSLTLMLFVWGYLIVGMVEEVVFFRKRRVAAQAARDALEAPVVAAAAADEEEEEEEELPAAEDDDADDDAPRVTPA